MRNAYETRRSRGEYAIAMAMIKFMMTFSIVINANAFMRSCATMAASYGTHIKSNINVRSAN